jgi:Rad3-related DNA helicase
LPGARLIGAFIATLGLAQFNPVNEQMKGRMAAIFGAGYDYTYLYPGVQKVVQAAGRVIRTQQDQGVVMLIDDRFGESKVRQLLPRWWAIAGNCSEHHSIGLSPCGSELARDGVGTVDIDAG